MTSDERRDVAERLRERARETNGTRDLSMYLEHWVNADEEQGGNPFTVQADRKSAERTLEKLADLIDPTCEVESMELRDECDEATPYTLTLSCGHRMGAESHGDIPRYCPVCGARVVSGDD